MLIRDLTDKQRKALQKVCHTRRREYVLSTRPLDTFEANLWDKAFSEGVRAILAGVDKLNE